MNHMVPYKYYSSVAAKNVDWLWYPYIPCGKLTLLQGDPGDGKSTFMMNLIACLTTAKDFPDGAENSNFSNVIYQCAEDGTEDTVKPRLIAAGADCTRVIFIAETDTELTISDNRIEETIRETDARLLVLDPIQAFIPQDADMQNAVRMRAMLRSLAKLAEKYNCAVVLIGHMNKAAGGKKLYRGLGSIDIAAIARSVLMISRDAEDPQIRYMYPVKSSLAPEGDAVAFMFDKDKGFQWIGRCVMNGDSSDELSEIKGNKREKAREIIKILLSAGDMATADVIQRLEEYDIKERTVRTAVKDLGVAAFKIDGRWIWRLEKSEDTEAEIDEGDI